MDYYHATGGRWEPLLERVVVKGDREIVKRTATRDRESWVFGMKGEVDDFIAGNGEGELSSVVRLSCFEEDVKVRRVEQACSFSLVGGACDDVVLYFSPCSQTPFSSVL